MNSNIKVKILEAIDKDVFNKFVEYSPYGDILQYWEWGETKRTEGWKPLRIAVIQERKILLTAQILLKKIPLLGNYAYIPHGPIFHHKEELGLALNEFNKFLIRQSKNYNFICIEIEPRIGQLVPIETEKKPASKSYVDKVFNKKSEEFVDDPLAENKVSLDAKMEDEEVLEIDPADFKIEKIKTLSLNAQNETKLDSKKKKHYTSSFYNLPPEKTSKDSQNSKNPTSNNKIKTSKGVEVITKDEAKDVQNSKQLSLYEKAKAKMEFNKNSLPLKTVNLRPIRSLPSFDKEEENSKKELEQARVKDRAKARLEKEFDIRKILGKEKNHREQKNSDLLDKDFESFLKKPGNLFKKGFAKFGKKYEDSKQSLNESQNKIGNEKAEKIKLQKLREKEFLSRKIQEKKQREEVEKAKSGFNDSPADFSELKAKLKNNKETSFKENKEKEVRVDLKTQKPEFTEFEKNSKNQKTDKNNENIKNFEKSKNQNKPKQQKQFTQSQTENQESAEEKPEVYRELPQLKENSAIKNLVDKEILEIFQKNGYDLTGRNMQPKYKLYYDLNESEEDLLAMCKKSTRYNIKYAAKKGVEVQEFESDHKLIKLKIQKFYKLLLETQKRAEGYPIRPIETFFNLFKAFRGMPNLSLFEASYDQEAIIINISQKTKYWSSSFYAGSNRKHSKLKAPYLIRWESILAAKKYGSKLYDFWGIIPHSENHKGYSDHKLSFGGIRVDNYGLLAFPISPIKYSIWDAGIWLRTEGKKEIRKIYWNLKTKIKQFFDKK